MKSKFHTAVFESNLDEVYRLINDVSDLDYVDETGDTPLMYAAGNEDIRLVELLISRGANVNAKGHKGYTTLHSAVDISIDGTMQAGGAQGDEPIGIISRLIECGADPTIANDKGETALDIAKAYSAKKIIAFLESKIE